MNELPEDSALRDRLHLIQIPGYSFSEKLKIAQDYVVPKTLKNLGICLDPLAPPDMGLRPPALPDIDFTKESLTYLIRKVSPDSDKGLRSMERAIRTIFQKINFLTICNKDVSFALGKEVKYPFTISVDDLKVLLRTESKSEQHLSMYI